MVSSRFYVNRYSARQGVSREVSLAILPNMLNTHLIGVDLAEDLAQARQIVLRGLAHHRAKVYLYGSTAKGRRGRISDIDIAVWPLEPLPSGTLAAIRQALEESNIPYPVEIVNLQDANEIFQARVLQEGVLWNAP